MAYRFTDPHPYTHNPGDFFLGVDDNGHGAEIRTERHLITIAGAGSGKGASLIVQNLAKWRGSCVVVDPKGENATITAGRRKNMGQLVGVVDPYRIAKDDAAGLRCSINPLAVMDPESLTIRADLEALGDGLIRRHDPKHAQWDDTAAAIIAGLADFVLADCPPNERTLLSVRGLLLLPEDDLKAIAAQMIATATSAGLARQAGTLIQNKFSNSEGVPAAAFARAVQETGWIDDPAFAAVLGGDALPAFDLSTLKAGTGSLYLCIPPGYLDTRGGFLRLFVRMGLMTMMRDLAGHGDKTGRCLFLLDEFHSLGKMEIVAKAAGLMRGYGVQLWPFLQDLGQLEALYGANEMHTFFGNADAHIFFGNTDARTLDYVSGRIGNLTPDEIVSNPPERKTNWGGMVSDPNSLFGYLNHAADVQYQNDMNDYQHRMRLAGTPRLTASEVRDLTAKRDGDAVARSMIVFAKGRDVLNIRLVPYFKATHRRAPPASSPPSKSKPQDAAAGVIVCLIVGAFGVLGMIMAGISVPKVLLWVAVGVATGAAMGWLSSRPRG